MVLETKVQNSMAPALARATMAVSHHCIGIVVEYMGEGESTGS
jgi:hypothetical protein